MLWRPSNALNYRVWRVPNLTLEGNSRKNSESVSAVFPEFFEFLPESPSRTGEKMLKVYSSATSWICPLFLLFLFLGLLRERKSALTCCSS